MNVSPTNPIDRISKSSRTTILCVAPWIPCGRSWCVHVLGLISQRRCMIVAPHDCSTYDRTRGTSLPIFPIGSLFFASDEPDVVTRKAQALSTYKRCCATKIAKPKRLEHRKFLLRWSPKPFAAMKRLGRAVRSARMRHRWSIVGSITGCE